MEILKLTDKNIQDEHICCAISDKKCKNGYKKKKEWLKKEFKNGYIFQNVDETKTKEFIEILPYFPYMKKIEYHNLNKQF